MNFCAACLEPSIAVNKPEADGREVVNLISQDPNRKKNGYMGEYFIRPPVEIVVTFKVPIDISHMKLDVELERKCSTAFAVFTQHEETSQGKDQSNAFKSCPALGSKTLAVSLSKSSRAPAVVGSSAPSTSEQSCEDSGKSETTEDVYFGVGTFYTQSEGCVILKNHHYKHWINMRMPVDNTQVNGLKVYKGALRHTNRLALCCVKRMMIKIMRTVSSDPPVLRAMEIWGQPGISTKKALRKDIISSWHGRVRTQAAVCLVPRIYNSVPEEEKQDLSIEEPSKSTDSFEIPEDFLDPLTCDIMTVPLLLPSGHSIDADTLDRYIANEAMWGRPASDPFTGVPFKSGKMPSPNVSLKARIDRFILLNGDHPLVQTCGRTLATSGTQFGRGLNRGIFNLNDSKQHHLDYSTKRKFDNVAEKSNREDVLKKDDFEGARKKSSRIEYSKGSVSGDFEGARNKSSRIEYSKGSVSDASGSDVAAGIRKSYTCQPKNVDTLESAGNPVLDSSAGSTLRNQTGDIKSNRTGSHLQIPRPARNQIRKPHQHLVTPKPSSGRHGLVQMIGSAYSRTQQRSDGPKSQDQRSLGKPSSLIQGDAKPENLSAIDLASKNSTSCHCGEKSELYSLLCNHLLCRNCLLLQQNNSEVKCIVCEELCKRSDVLKYHKRSIFSPDP